jgi:23S rRNA pseudouridine2605 synthase
MYLTKYLAHAGVCSRRMAVVLIQEGKVSVNNACIKQPSYVVKDTDVVRVQRKVIELQKHVYLLLNKPKGYVTTTSDEQDRKTVMDLIEDKKVTQRVFPVGRLDRDSTGLLLLTNDGSLSQHLSHPRYGVNKVYCVTLDKPLARDHERALIQGFELKDGFIKVDGVRVLNQSRTRVNIILHSGKNRIIRRIFEHMGYNVIKLDRIVYGSLSKRGLPVGRWRFLTEKEIKELRSSIVVSSAKNAQQHQEKVNKIKVKSKRTR